MAALVAAIYRGRVACWVFVSPSPPRHNAAGGTITHWTGSGPRLPIGHYGRGGGPTGAITFDDLPEMLAFAHFPNVGVKVSGAPSYTNLPNR